MAESTYTSSSQHGDMILYGRNFWLSKLCGVCGGILPATAIISEEKAKRTFVHAQKKIGIFPQNWLVKISIMLNWETVAWTGI